MQLGLVITHLDSALLLEITMSYLLTSNHSNACGLRVSASLWDFPIMGNFWIKLVVTFRDSKRGLPCCQKTLVKISASGKILISSWSTSSAPHQSFIQSQTIATRLFFIELFIYRELYTNKKIFQYEGRFFMKLARCAFSELRF